MQTQQQVTKNGLLPTPLRPNDLPAVELTGNARQVRVREHGTPLNLGAGAMIDRRLH